MVRYGVDQCLALHIDQYIAKFLGLKLCLLSSQNFDHWLVFTLPSLSPSDPSFSSAKLSASVSTSASAATSTSVSRSVSAYATGSVTASVLTTASLCVFLSSWASASTIVAAGLWPAPRHAHHCVGCKESHTSPDLSCGHCLGHYLCLRISVDHCLPLKRPTLSQCVPLFACSSLSGMMSTSALVFTSVIVSAGVRAYASESVSRSVSTSALAFTAIIVSASVRAYACASVSSSVSRSVSSDTSASTLRRVSSSATPPTSPRQCLSGWLFILPIVSLRVQSSASLACQPACRPVPWHPQRLICSLVF